MTTNAVMTLADLRNQLATKEQVRRATMPTPSSTKIKVVAKQGFELPTGETLDHLEAVVLDFRYINTYYAKRYVAGQVESPVCWSLSDDATTMVPDETSSKPQHADCAECPMNQWESAGGGSKGKACKNSIRLALVSPDATDKSPILTLDLAPTSTQSFIKAYGALRVPLQTVIFNFTLDSKVDYGKVISAATTESCEGIAPYLLGLMDRAVGPVTRGFNYD